MSKDQWIKEYEATIQSLIDEQINEDEFRSAMKELRIDDESIQAEIDEIKGGY